MHELSVAAAIAEVASRHAGGRTVHRVDVRVGYLRQVVPSALEFSWQMVTHETSLEGAALVLEEVPARGSCRACGHSGLLPGFPLCCSACGSLDVAITAGEELVVEAIELDAAAPGEIDRSADSNPHQWSRATGRQTA
ncbi:MAG TPA: hydrogenase maturation nickel metallochaperone HypA [Gaiellaceae bacterium]|nr:hydrogenase maturation nickel metallochaperone HypA [Gaiellaceae bacterium]